MGLRREKYSKCLSGVIIKIMKIRFSFGWTKEPKASRKSFKSPEAYALASDYAVRIGHFMPCEMGSYLAKERSCLWVCEREKGSRTLSSEALARELQKVMNSGVQELQVVIGGPDGFTAQDLARMAPVLSWSFGPMTLPHELAAVVATEQVYRTLTILHGQPYHSGH